MKKKQTILSAALAVASLTSLAADKVFLYSPANDKGVHIAYAAEGRACRLNISVRFSSPIMVVGELTRRCFPNML